MSLLTQFKRKKPRTERNKAKQNKMNANFKTELQI